MTQHVEPADAWSLVEHARAAFHDPDGIDEDDPDPHEKRFNRLCRLNREVFVVVYTERGKRTRIISARVATSMSNAITSSNERDKYGMTAEDYRRYGITAEDYRRRLEMMTDEEITAAALADPDNPPLTDEELARFRRPALSMKVRLKLRMGRETFSAAYGIPVETLKAWERFKAEPTEVELAYLRLIERAPELAKIRAETAAQ